MYIVNKKLQQMDRAARNRELEELQRDKEEHKCFTKVHYRKLNVQFSETGPGVEESGRQILVENLRYFSRKIKKCFLTTLEQNLP